MHDVVFMCCNLFYVNMMKCFYHMHIFLFIPLGGGGDGLPDEKITPQMLARRKRLLEAYRRALKDGVLSFHGASEEWEFFAEIKVWEEFDKKTLPKYIGTLLKEFV